MLTLVKTCTTYSRRQPECTPCYQIIQEELNSFVREREAEGRPLPQYVLDEFDAYLKCGILAHGFLKLSCKDCHADKIVAFSCKKRGFCPSCCGKRMSEAARHLVDHVLPLVPYRQFVISFPVPLRYWLQASRPLYAKIHKLVITELHRYYIDKARAHGIKEPTPGSIAFTQRFGSACNLNIHIHVLCPDGVYTRVRGKPLFRPIGAITDGEVAELITLISQRVISLLKKRGILDQDGSLVENPLTDTLFNENESLSQAIVHSIAGKIAFGPNAGRYVTRVGAGFGYEEEVPLVKGRRCFSINGFSLHANTSINTLRRDRLEQLIQYLARGPISNARLEITKDRKVKLRLKTAYRDGTSHLLFSFGEFIEKLVALIPPPKQHLVRWAGVFAANSSYRKEIILKPQIKKGFQFKDEEEKPGGLKNSAWSKMLARVFKIDVATCERCGGDMAVVCAVMARHEVIRYLQHVSLNSDPPARAPPRFTAECLGF